MFLMLYIFFSIFMVCSILMMLASMISKKTFMDREKTSPFECGFDPKSSSRLPFSLQFFLIAVIFLIFDMEITLLIPLILIFNMSNFFSFFLLSNIFFFLLVTGTYHEWIQGALDWS